MGLKQQETFSMTKNEVEKIKSDVKDNGVRKGAAWSRNGCPKGGDCPEGL